MKTSQMPSNFISSLTDDTESDVKGQAYPRIVFYTKEVKDNNNTNQTDTSSLLLFIDT